jgi:hypothetical protein
MIFQNLQRTLHSICSMLSMFQEHLLRFLMLAVTCECCYVITALDDTLNSKLTSSIYQRYQPLYLPNIIFLALCFELFLNLRGKIEKNIVLYLFYKPFCLTCLLYSTRRCAPRALKNAYDKMVFYKTRIINYYFRMQLAR